MIRVIKGFMTREKLCRTVNCSILFNIINEKTKFSLSKHIIVEKPDVII